jgi:lipid II:glycine glycyltransferase (peptidoglycan interpeptide bridge formation enzyme)
MKSKLSSLAAWEQLRPRGMMRVLLAECSEAGHRRLLAGSVFLMLGQTVFYAFNGRRRDDLALHPNDALQWRAIQDACAGGFRYYDLGEVTKNHPSLAQFKSKWGAKPQETYRYYYPAPRELEVGLLESNSRVCQLAHMLWRHMPIAATVGLSDWAHRYF